MTHHQAFLNFITRHPQSVNLLRVCRAYKTSTGGYAFDLNGRLKGGLPIGSMLTVDLPFLQSIICAKLSDPIMLYRMTSNIEFSVPYVDAIRGEFRYQAFMSTTNESSRLTSFVPKSGALLLEITCPAGFALAPMDLFPGTDEDEYLLGCGTTFKALGSPRVLNNAEAREYIPFYEASTLDFLRLEVLKNPPYVNRAGLIAL
jgi:hypothetical protein